jgi:Cu(I)/Ag(I) efflux system membrane fusion protein
MPLVKAQTLGYASSSTSTADAPLIIPASAPLVTGKRAVVYVELNADGGALFEGREVVLGPRAGDFYVVHSGLKEGELVVTNGAFKIDSELQIRAKPSMMSPESGPSPGLRGHDHGETRPSERTLPAQASHNGSTVIGGDTPLRGLFQQYFAIQTALAKDDLEGARTGYAAVAEVLKKIPPSRFSEEEQRQWTYLSEQLHQAASAGAVAVDIVRARDVFYDISRPMIQTQETFGNASSAPVYLAYCPMARDNDGASWLQTTDTISNPYFGDAMLRCGEVQNTFPPEATREE